MNFVEKLDEIKTDEVVKNEAVDEAGGEIAEAGFGQVLNPRQMALVASWRSQGFREDVLAIACGTAFFKAGIERTACSPDSAQSGPETPAARFS